VTSDGKKAVAFFAGTAALAVVVLSLGTRLLGLAAGPESEIITLLKATEKDGLVLEVPGVPERLVSTRHHFERLVVEVDDKGRTAQAVSTLDFEGRLGRTKLSSLGLERISFEHRGGRWSARAHAPILVQVAALLEARRQALHQGDLAALSRLSGQSEQAMLEHPELFRILSLQNRSYRATAWYVRSDREEVLVGEDFHLQGDTPDRPIDEKGSKRLLLRRSHGEFFFEGGVM
jgi:hypothetical protein